MRKKWLLLILVVLAKFSQAQTTTDTIIQPEVPKISDTVPTRIVPQKHIIKKRIHLSQADSILRKARKDSLLAQVAPPLNIPSSLYKGTDSTQPWKQDSFKFAAHPYFKFTDPVRLNSSIKKWHGKEDIFYSLVSLLILFALIKNGFYRYVMDLFRIFFRTTVRQRQIKEQLIQSPLPSLLLNIFFLITGALFIDILLHNFEMGTGFDFWMLFLYAALALLIIYGIKFLTLKFFGWVFQVSDTVDTYIFIVFTANKILGIFLLPFVVILSFSSGVLHEVAVTLSLFLVIGLLAYRYFFSYVSLQRQLNISFFHFALYFCALEIAPVLLINKLLFRFFI